MTLPGTEFDVVADDGIRLHGIRWGAPSGAPVVLGIHGLTATRFGMLPVARALGDDVTFVAYDVRGRGLSDKPADRSAYGHRRNALDAATVLRSVGTSDVVVVGQSNGAWIAEQLAAHHPDLVRALVLGDGGYFRALDPGEDAAERPRQIMGADWLDRLRMTFPSREVVLQVFRSLPAFADWWDDDVETLLDAGLVEVDGGVRSRCSDVAADVDATDYFTGTPHYVHADLALIRCPVHLVRSEQGFAISPETMTPMISDAEVEEFQAALPQLTVELVPGTNHYSVNFAPAGAQVIAEAVRKFLA
ncbi:MAG TPA: alpha/beta hydrolase [Mycobacteriales bacterium]|jgi:pimeloyl-ACP methyl ester carboxylesterase|nr:alpha/beta hydrolase [Mycobacteriales bacterium]